MSIGDVFAVLRGRPEHPVGPGGRMEFSDHLRELRARILKAAGVILIGFVVAMFFYHQLFAVVDHPYALAKRHLGDKTLATTEGAAGGFMLYLKLCGLAALIVTAPVWLYQIWAFVMPGLHAHEKKWTAIFVSIAGPLFLAGCALGYLTMPKALEFMIGFTPHGVTNLVNFDEYLTFFAGTLVTVGIGFEIPVFVVILNRVGVLSGAMLKRFRPWIIVGVFCFTAVVTPTTDPFVMTIMAVPLVVLLLISEAIARHHDRHKVDDDPYAGLDPDQPSPL